MEAKLPVTFLAVLALAVAGCTSAPATEPVGPTTAPPAAGSAPGDSAPSVPNATVPEAGPTVTAYDGTSQGVGAPGVIGITLDDGSRFSFEVANGTTAIVVELAWQAAESMALRVYVPEEYCESQDPVLGPSDCGNPEGAEGTSPLKIVVTEPDQLAKIGTWNGVAFAYTPTGVAWNAYVSLFTGEPPAASYTAIPPG